MKIGKNNSRYGAICANKFKSLKQLIDIVNSPITDSRKAILMRRLYPTYEEYRSAFYVKVKSVKVKSKDSYYLDDTFLTYAGVIQTIGELYKRYESEGLFDKAKEDDKFLLRQANDLDARYVIEAYINDGISYDQDAFYSRYKLKDDIFRSCVTRVKTNAPELYDEYLKVFEDNKTKRLVMPMYNILQIIEGIKTGKTYDGEKFDKYEFYKLAPFKNKDIDYEVRTMSKDFPKLEVFKRLKQNHRSENKENGVKICTYADNLYLFTRCFSKDADLLKEWMDENGIRNLTPIYRASTVNCYINGTGETDFTKEDSEAIFDIIEEKGYPKIREVYNLIKEDMIKNKKGMNL